MSVARTTLRTQSATSTSTASPSRWPIRSLIRLKSSRSNTITRDVPLVAVGAGDLAAEELVEDAAVVQAGQRVELGLLAGLDEAQRVPDRRARPAGEVLERVRRRLGEARRARAADRRQRADRLALGAQGHGQRGTRKLRGGAHVVEPVAVDDLERPQVRVVRHLEQRSLDLVLAQPGRARCRRRVAFVADRDQRGIDPRQRDDRVERPVEHVRGIEGGCELARVARVAEPGGVRRPWLQGDRPCGRARPRAPLRPQKGRQCPQQRQPQYPFRPKSPCSAE